MSARSPRIFISYKHNLEPDDGLARQIYERLCKSYSVFRDKENILVGEKWAQRIQHELSVSDFVISLLSAESVQSEMVKGEIEQAHKIQKKKGGPAILPVRVAYKEPFESPLSLYLNSINWTYWENNTDTEGLLRELEAAIEGSSLSIDVSTQAEWLGPTLQADPPAPRAEAQPRLELPEGTMDPHSNYYVVRASDEIALNAIVRDGGVTIPIKGPRQVGKSSLLIRAMDRAIEVGKKVIFLDFQLFDEEALTDADIFFPRFCTWITDELDLEDRVEETWKLSLGNSQLCTRYVRRYLLKQLDRPIVLAMDEVERVFVSDFRSDFFSMLRSWHNERAFKPEWRQLDLVLVTSTEPYQLIDNLNQSPFNVGEVIEMSDFDESQAEWLNLQHHSTFSDSALKQLHDYLHGHPYLTRRAMYLVASGRYTESQLMKQASDDRGPFGDHLRYHLFRMHDKEELVRGFLNILSTQHCDSEETFWRLRGAGLVRKEGNNIVPRCKLYADYFRAHLHEK